jgi:signal transduction histidine kinase
MELKGRMRGKVVYKRDGQADESVPPELQNWLTAEGLNIAPTLKPLLIGFAMLLVLVVVLGLISVHRLNVVSSSISDLEQQYASRFALLLNLRVAWTKLNTEARMRADMEARGGIKPPLDIRLRMARGELEDLLPLIDRIAPSQESKWQAFKRNLEQYIETTKDLERFSLNGFNEYRQLDNQFEDLLADMKNMQDEILKSGNQLQSEAKKEIQFWTLIVLLTGATVAIGTIWEIQKRFRLGRASLDIARRERQFSVQILEGMISAIAAIDAKGTIRGANSAFFDIFRGASVGGSIHDSNIGPSEALKLLEVVTSQRIRRASYFGRWMFNSDEGNVPRTFDAYASPLEIGEEFGLIFTLVDVTEAVQIESELRHKESLAAVGQAIAQVAHEIKNPLGSIRLGVSMLRGMTNDGSEMNTIDLVERGIDHLNKLTVDITQFSRQRPLSRSETDLQDLIDESLELVQDKIEEKHIRIEKRIGSDRLSGFWDADQLRQVLVNLLSNAIDASEHEAPITINAEQASLIQGSNGGSNYKPIVNIVITDNGTGMDEQTTRRIFEPFFTTKARGTGLGLAIVKKIIEQHGGQISVSSKVDEGTRFTIELPLTPIS